MLNCLSRKEPEMEKIEDKNNVSYKENCVANNIIDQLNNYDLGYSNWLHILDKVEQSYSPWPITSIN